MTTLWLAIFYPQPCIKSCCLYTRSVEIWDIRVLNLKTRLLSNSNFLYNSEPYKNKIIFIIPFNIQYLQLFKKHFPSGTSYPLFWECNASFNITFKPLLYTITCIFTRFTLFSMSSCFYTNNSCLMYEQHNYSKH